MRFEDVVFAYDPAGPIKGVSFEIPAGKTVAVVSHRARAKIHAGAAAVRFYDIQQGRITIAGQEIRSVTQSSVRQAIGIVPQDTVLFNDTVAYNIAYGRTGARSRGGGAPHRRSHPDFIAATPKGLRHHGGRAGAQALGR